MNFYDLRSVISSKKSKFKIENASPSFQVSANITRRYIEPSFAKVDGFFDVEQPTFLLISAVGASGKSMLSMKLSLAHGPAIARPRTPRASRGTRHDRPNHDELCKYRPERSFFRNLRAENLESSSMDLTKALKSRREALRSLPRRFATAFQRLAKDQFCPPRKGQDRGRLLAVPSGQRSNRRAGVSRPLHLGQSPRVHRCIRKPAASWTNAELHPIERSDLSKLSDAFSQEGDRFLSFVGYPPVLDAVATLLDGEKNYHKLSTEVGGGQARR